MASKTAYRQPSLVDPTYESSESEYESDSDYSESESWDDESWSESVEGEGGEGDGGSGGESSSEYDYDESDESSSEESDSSYDEESDEESGEGGEGEGGGVGGDGDDPTPADFSSAMETSRPRAASSARPIAPDALAAMSPRSRAAATSIVIAKVLSEFDFEPFDQGHLAFSKRRVLNVTDEYQGWMWGYDPRDGRDGRFPGNFVKKLEPEVLRKPVVPADPPTESARVGAKPHIVAVALHDFPAPGGAPRLALCDGDEVRVFDEAEGWMWGRTTDGRIGRFPSQYVLVLKRRDIGEVAVPSQEDLEAAAAVAAEKARAAEEAALKKEAALCQHCRAKKYRAVLTMDTGKKIRLCVDCVELQVQQTGQDEILGKIAKSVEKAKAKDARSTGTAAADKAHARAEAAAAKAAAAAVVAAAAKGDEVPAVEETPAADEPVDNDGIAVGEPAPELAETDDVDGVPIEGAVKATGEEAKPHKVKKKKKKHLAAGAVAEVKFVKNRTGVKRIKGASVERQSKFARAVEEQGGIKVGDRPTRAAPAPPPGASAQAVKAKLKAARQSQSDTA
jgi:hypothetical protein